MHRFFISPEAFEQQPIVLTGDQAHQVRRVLRMRLGDRAVLLNGQGWACEGILIVVGENDVRFQAVRRWEAGGEPRTQIALFQAVLKGERFGWVLQKGTEIGISAFVPLICERNVVDDMDAVDSPGKRTRWERIIQEAAEQSGRGRLPALLPAQLFAQAVTQPELSAIVPARGDEAGAAPAASGKTADDVQLLLWEGERAVTLGDALAGCNFTRGVRIQVLVGPEGGFTDEEVRLAKSYGVQAVTLGPRILRAETAGIVAAAIILHEAGEMGRVESPDNV